MTNLQAISAEIEPYSVSDESLEKGFLDACDHFGITASVSSTYAAATYHQCVALAAMYCLNRLRVLTSENIGGISQAYNVQQLEKRIEAIAASANISADLVLADGSNDDIEYISI